MKFIFVGGCPRSGTTLLAKLLSQVFNNSICLHESQFLLSYLSKFSCNKKYSYYDLDNYLQNHPRFTIWPQKIPTLSSDCDVRPLDFLMLQLNIKPHIVPSISTVIDHTPDNIIRGYDLQTLLGDHSELFFIHIVRDGRAVFSSLKKCDWGPKSPHACSDYWVRYVSRSELVLRGMHPSYHLTVKYEDLVNNKDRVLQEISNVVGLDLGNNEFCYQPPSYTLKQHRKLLSSSVNTSSLLAWQDNLTNSEIMKFTYYSRDVLKAYDYYTDFIVPPPLSLNYQLITKARSLYRRFFK